MSKDKKENERRAKKTLPSGITLQRDTWRNPTSTMNTSTQGGSSSSLSRVVPLVITSETGNREFENQENNRHLKTGSLLSGEESQEILIQESIKRAMTPILKGLMTKFAKDGTIYEPDEGSREVETDDHHTEKEKEEAKRLWQGGGEVPRWFLGLTTKWLQKMSNADEVVEDLYHNVNEMRELKREIQRLTEQNDALRQARKEALDRSKSKRESSDSRRNPTRKKEDWGSKVESRFPNENPRGRPEGKGKGKGDRSQESNWNERGLNSIESEPREAQDEGGGKGTGEPTQRQKGVVIYPEPSRNSTQTPFIPIGMRLTTTGKIKTVRPPFDQTRGKEGWERRQDKKAIARNHEDSRDHFPSHGTSQNRPDRVITWGDIPDLTTSHAADRDRELAGLAEEMAGLKGPDPSSSASMGFNLNKKQRRELQREEYRIARDPPESHQLMEEHRLALRRAQTEAKGEGRGETEEDGRGRRSL